MSPQITQYEDRFLNYEGLTIRGKEVWVPWPDTIPSQVLVEREDVIEKALAPLAQVLDDRRTLTSVQAGMHLKAHRDFLFCAAMNAAEAGGIGLPDFIDERLRPAIYVDHPGRAVLEKILKNRVPEAQHIWFKIFLEEYQQEELSPREAVKLLAYAYRLYKRDNRRLTEAVVNEYLDRALPEATRLSRPEQEPELAPGNQVNLEVPLSHLPLVSSLLIEKEGANYTYFPFSPNDAGCLGLHWAWKHHLPMECVDDSRLANYPTGSLFHPAIFLKDDYLVFKEGLEHYFAPVWERMKQCWSQATLLERYFSAVRASVIGDRLEKILATGKRALFLCEYRLWWLVKKWLTGNLERPTTPLLRGPKRQVALILENPVQFWLTGLLDDYPLINEIFWQILQRGDLQDFDKLKILALILDEAFTENTVKGEAPSIRLATIFFTIYKDG